MSRQRDADLVRLSMLMWPQRWIGTPQTRKQVICAKLVLLMIMCIGIVACVFYVLVTAFSVINIG